ncbi:LLM class oxidoreductase [Streptacidiphilus sp. PAMC 29251]
MPSITLDAERRVAADAGRVRTAAVDVLRRLGFRVTSEMATVVEAQRGSAVRSAMLMPDQVPVGARLQFTPEPGGSSCALHLTDRSVSAVVLGVQGPYQAAFQALLQALDQALAQLDPAAAKVGFAEPRWWVRGPNVEALERGHAVGQRLVGGMSARISERLSGGPRSTGPTGWSGYDRLVVSCSAGAVTMEMSTARTLLAIPVMISSRPGALPPPLAAKVEQLAALIEQRLNSGGRGTLAVELPEDQRKTFEFLHQQLGIRSQLPVRTLCVCRDCRHPKVVNLDLQRLREKNRNLKMLASVVSMSAGRGEPNPFMVFGTVFRQAKLDPDFICGRCESTEADEQPVTFCPGCGDLRKEPVLVTCGKCSHDFRVLVKGAPIWEKAAPAPPKLLPPGVPPVALPPVPQAAPPQLLPPVPYAAAPQLLPPAPLPARQPPPARQPRKVCAICGNAYPTLWWVQVAEGASRRTLAVCATSPRCSPPSLLPPVRTLP